MIRAFVAIEIPQHLREELNRIIRQLEVLGLDGRPARVSSIHLTLKFLGPVEESRLSAIRRALRDVAAASPLFALSVKRMGVFPHLERPRVVWLGIDAGEGLTGLQAAVEAALADLGFPSETRPFAPHLTLMRLKSARNLAALVRFLRDQGLRADAGGFAAAEFHLYQSVLKPSGAEYAKLETFPLTGPPSG